MCAINDTLSLLDACSNGIVCDTRVIAGIAQLAVFEPARETLLQDAETQRCGFCAINSLKGMSPKAFNRKFMPKMLESVQNRLPIRIGALVQHMGLPSTRASELAKNTS